MTAAFEAGFEAYWNPMGSSWPFACHGNMADWLMGLDCAASLDAALTKIG